MLRLRTKYAVTGNAVFTVLLACPALAFTASSKPSSSSGSQVVFHVDTNNGHGTADLKNITPGSHPRSVSTNGSHSGSTPGITPNFVRGGSASIVVDFGEQTWTAVYYYYNEVTCASSPLTPTVTTAPQYGNVTYAIGSGTLTGGSCAGTVIPITIVYYTWETHTSASLSDYFVFQSTDPYGDLFYGDVTPELLAKGNGDCCDGVGDPINVGAGNVFEQVVDYQTAGQNKLSYIRYYNSLADSNTFASTLGQQWRSNYGRYLYFYSSSLIIAERPDGQLINFNGNGSTWTSDSDADYTLTQSGSTWTLKDHDDTVETYTQLSSGQEGLLQSIARRNGYTQNMAYNSSNQLTSVTDSTTVSWCSRIPITSFPPSPPRTVSL